MQFESPYMLLLLALLIPAVLMLLTQKRSSLKMFDPDILKLLMSQNETISARSRSVLTLVSMALIIISLSRPIVEGDEIEIKNSTINTIVGFDISRSMFANDIYPNRLEFAKKKFEEFLSSADGMRIGVVGFSSRSFLISPLTEDFNTLKYLVTNMNLDTTSLRGTDVLSVLKQAKLLLEDSKDRAMVLFTDGGDKDDFSQEIEYAKSNNITLFIYNIATSRGGIIETEDGALNDKDGNIVVVRRNDQIASLAQASGGVYMNYSLNSSDIKKLTDSIRSRFKATEGEIESIRDTKELFVYPLILAVISLILALYSLPKGRSDG